MKNLALILAAGSVAVSAVPAQAFTPLAAPAPTVATYAATTSPLGEVASYDRRWEDRRYDDRRYDDRGRYDRRYDDRRYDDRRYDDRRYDDRRYEDQRYWRGEDGRLRCRKKDGTVGLVIGAGVGALLGREVDRRGDRSLGTILGAVGGGLLGREVARGDGRCR